MNKLAIYPYIREFKDGKRQWGYTSGWLFEDKDGRYSWKFGLYKTREEAEGVSRKKHPEVEIVHFDEPIKDRDIDKPMHMTFAQFEKLMGKFDEALERRRASVAK